MSDPFLGEIRLLGFSFAPKGWALCNGQILNVNQNQALYSLLGNQFGGTAPTTFALPDLRGRVPVHTSAGVPQGSVGGSESVALTLNNMPAHTHTLMATSQAGDRNGVAVTRNLAQVTSGSAYAEPGGTQTTLNSQAVAPTGGSSAHSNMQPYQVVNFAIALSGLYPSRP